VTGSGRPDEFRGAEFVDLDMSDARFREVDLSRVHMTGVLLTDADIDGDIRGLRLNGVEVAPLVEAELDRRYPERTKLRPTTVEGIREALAVVEGMWDGTMARARGLPEADLHRSVDGEWSFAQTLRHLVFVTDAWVGHAIELEPRPFHPLGLPASFITDGPAFGIDERATPTFAEVAELRAGRLDKLRAFLAALTDEDLNRVCGPNLAPGWPPPGARSPTSCLHVVFDEEWAHHQFAVRDLALVEALR